MKILNKEIDATKWAIASQCSSCGWERRPTEKWTVRDCLAPPGFCPVCSSRLKIKKYKCHYCGDSFPNIRWPKTLRMALWGGNYCKKCNIETDKWGMLVKSNDIKEN